MKVCVTGGAGFIGSNLVDRLLASGHDVVVLDDLSTGRASNLAHVLGDVRFVEADVRDAAAVRAAASGCEVIFHQAALASVPRSIAYPAEVTAVNVLGALNVLVAARDVGARRVVLASSSSVYGDTPDLPKHEGMPVLPRSPYAASKCAAESYVAAFRGSFGLEGVALRYFNVYGPRQRPDSPYAAVIPRFIEAMRDGRAPVVFGDGEQTRDFTFVDDVVGALCLAATTPEAPDGPYNIGSGGSRTSINHLVRVIAEAVGFRGEPVYRAARPGDVRDSLADIGAAQAWLGWRPEITLEAGIRRTVEAFASVATG